MQPDLRCYYHPDAEATSQCDRCGDYLCARCTQERQELNLCGRCFEELERFDCGSDLRIAAMLNGVVVILGLLLFRAGISVVICWIVLFIVCLAALFLGARARKAEGFAGKMIRRSFILTSGGAIYLLLAIAIFLMQTQVSFDGNIARWELRGVYGLWQAALHPWIEVCMGLGWLLPAALACNYAVRARREGLRPGWVIVLAEATPCLFFLLGTCFVFLS